MAEVDNSAIIGAFTARPTGYGQTAGQDDGQLETLKRYDSSLGRAGHDRMHYRPASFYTWSLYVLTTANNNAKESAIVKAPWPMTIWAADVGCETCAATTGTVDIEVGGTSILDAAEDVKTTAGTCVRVAPEDGNEDLDYDDAINIVQTAGSAADMIGGQAHLYCQRL